MTVSIQVRLGAQRHQAVCAEQGYLNLPHFSALRSFVYKILGIQVYETDIEIKYSLITNYKCTYFKIMLVFIVLRWS